MASKTFGLLANGPSATADDARKLRGIVDYLIAVNDSYKLCKGADGKYFCDAVYGTDYKWWCWSHADLARDFDGELITQRVQWQIEPESWGITCYESENHAGLCRESGKIYTGSNSGYAAVNVAAHLAEWQAGTVLYLLGYDMGYLDKRQHAVTGRPAHLNVDVNYDGWVKLFETIKPKDYGLRIVNLSRRTKLNCFELGDLDELCAPASLEAAPAFVV